jgi:hypothetical protein
MAQKLRNFGILDYVSQRQTNALEKGIKLQLKRSRLDVAKNLYSRDLRGHFGCVNAIEFSPCGGEYIASGTYFSVCDYCFLRLIANFVRL